MASCRARVSFKVGAASSQPARRRRPISVLVVHSSSNREPVPNRFKSLSKTWAWSLNSSPATPVPAQVPCSRATPRRYQPARREKRSAAVRLRRYLRRETAATGSESGGYHSGTVRRVTARNPIARKSSAATATNRTAIDWPLRASASAASSSANLFGYSITTASSAMDQSYEILRCGGEKPSPILLEQTRVLRVRISEDTRVECP